MKYFLTIPAKQMPNTKSNLTDFCHLVLFKIAVFNIITNQILFDKIFFIGFFQAKSLYYQH